MERRNFFRSSLGALLSLPFLKGMEGTSQMRASAGTLLPMRMHSILPKPLILRELTMSPDTGIVGGYTVSMSELQTTIAHRTRQPAGFGVIYYLDPRGLFVETDTDADV